MTNNRNLPGLLQFILIYGTFFLGFVLSTIPWSAEFTAYKPLWILVLLLYWAGDGSRKVSYISALILGILMDSLSATNLGQHAICYIVVVFFVHRFALIFRSLPVIVKFFLIALIISIYTIVFSFLELFNHNLVTLNASLYGPIVASTVMWLWVHYALDILQYWLASKFSRTLSHN